jgi:hypothetical protein
MRPTPSGSRMRTDPPPDRWRFDCEWPVGSHALVSGAIRNGDCTVGVSGWDGSIFRRKWEDICERFGMDSRVLLHVRAFR